MHDWRFRFSSAARLRSLLCLRARMSLEGARGRELAEFVPDHVLRDVHGDVPLAVMHGEGQADEVRRDRRTTRPRFDRGRTVAARANAFDRLREIVVYERAFFD